MAVTKHAGLARRNYALALALIPDPSAADDLFLAARDEKELRHRANKWRQQNGFLPAPAEIAAPDLDLVQAEHLEHLLSRQRRRRSVRVWISVAASLAFALGGWGLWSMQGPAASNVVLSDRLAFERAFSGPPVAQSETVNFTQFQVYRVEDRNGGMVVWWTLSGPAVGRLGNPDTPILTHPESNLPIYASGSQFQMLPNGQWTLGRSVYAGAPRNLQWAILSIPTLSGRPVNWELTVRVVRPGR